MPQGSEQPGGGARAWHVLRWGAGQDGRAVLLLHGLGQDAGAWQTVAPVLARSGATVFAPDLPGHGGSPLPGGPRVTDVAQALEPAVRAVAAEAGRPLHVVAHSFAAPVAMALLGRLPSSAVATVSLICALGVVAPQPGLVPNLPHVLAPAVRQLARLPATIEAALSALFAAPERQTPETWRRLADGIARADLLWRYGNRLLEDVPPVLPVLAARERAALFVWAEADPVLAAAGASLAVEAARPPRHRVVRLPGTGHLPMLEAPDALAAVLLDWIEGR